MLSFLSLLASACSDGSDLPRRLEIRSSPLPFSRDVPALREQGKLRWRGSLDLRSSDRDFGGLSGLLVSEDGASFLAVSDQSHWVSGTLSYTNGMLSGAGGSEIAPMLDLDGVAMSGKAGDAEGLAVEPSSGDLFVSFEGPHRLWRYDWAERGARALPIDLPLPEVAVRAHRNGGLEGIVRIEEGRLFAVTEHSRNAAGNYRAWLLPYASPGETLEAEEDAREIAIRPLSPFSMTDIRVLPDGNLLTLERRFNTVKGVGIQLRRLPAASLRGEDAGGGDPLDGEIVGQLDASFEIDNMEGLAVRRGENGETLVYLLSDDNFNRPLQRTLLLMFELLP